jgi:hypothetical protein
LGSAVEEDDASILVINLADKPACKKMKVAEIEPGILFSLEPQAVGISSFQLQIKHGIRGEKARKCQREWKSHYAKIVENGYDWTIKQ